MPWVRFVEIGGFKIVGGFDPPSIDPVETAKVVDPLLAETDEHKHLESLGQQFGELERRRQGLLGAGRRARNHGELQAAQSAYEAVVKDQRAIQRHAAEYKPKHLAKHRTLFETHAVRFEVPGCQEITQDVRDKLTDALTLLGPGQLLTIDGHVLTDHRGEEYWFKAEGEWLKTIITEFGEELPLGAKLRAELTDDDRDEIRLQGELERIGQLSDEKRAQEKKDRIQDALAIAARVRSQYEIEERPDALELSKQWYNEEKTRLENLYQ